MHNSSLVSIIVCTRNRADKLGRTLEAILALEVPDGCDYEVIIVDNGSSDQTAEVCASWQSASKGRLRRAFLSLPGLSRAGNTGFEVARGGIIAFLDDDILPRRDWLNVVHREFSADPDLGGISGQVELYSSADLVTAVRRHTERIKFQAIDHAFNLFIGCNLVVRREVIENIGLFDTDIGTGSRFGSAGDSDFFYRAWKAGTKLIYVPELFVYHDHGRRTRKDKLKVGRDYIVGRGAFYCKHLLRRDSEIVREMYWELIKGWISLFDRKDDLRWRHLTWLLKGILGYGLMRLTRRIAPRLWADPSQNVNA